MRPGGAALSGSATRTFRVRQYECDVYGHVNNTNYVRYMQETATDALAAQGYGPAELSGQGLRWQTCMADIEYLRPLYYGNTVTVTMQVLACTPHAVRRAFVFTSSDGAEPVARAQTDSVLMRDDEPATLPQLLLDAFCDAAPLAELPALEEPFPTAPPQPPGVFTIRQPVAWRDLDRTRRLNDAAYLVYIEDCGMGVVAAHGWPASRMLAHGFAITLRRHQVEYLHPAVLDDELEVATWASGLRRVSAIRHYTIKRSADGLLLTRVHTLGVWVDVSSGRPIRIPDDFLADFAPNLA